MVAPPKRLDALVVIAHHTHVVGAAAQQPHRKMELRHAGRPDIRPPECSDTCSDNTPERPFPAGTGKPYYKSGRQSP